VKFLIRLIAIATASSEDSEQIAKIALLFFLTFHCRQIALNPRKLTVGPLGHSLESRLSAVDTLYFLLQPGKGLFTILTW